MNTESAELLTQLHKCCGTIGFGISSRAFRFVTQVVFVAIHENEKLFLFTICETLKCGFGVVLNMRFSTKSKSQTLDVRTLHVFKLVSLMEISWSLNVGTYIESGIFHADML